MATTSASSSDVKSQHVLDFLAPLLAEHFQSQDWSAVQASSAQPFFLGINGIQGAGKTTLVSRVADVLRGPKYGLATSVLSIDDLYLPHDELKTIAEENAQNPLLQHRGQPGTHDVPLGLKVFKALRDGAATPIPAYDKSGFEGEGDRVPISRWEWVNCDASRIKVVIFEGWCVGFKALSADACKSKWSEAQEARVNGNYKGRLGWNSLSSIETLNSNLKNYDKLWSYLDALVHIDAQDIQWVYDWRLQAEASMMSEKGSAMAEDKVKQFVDGYYPAYELFYERLRKGMLDKPGRQLRLVLDKERVTQDVIKL